MEGITLVNMGRNHLALGNLVAARDDVTTALAIERAIGNDAVAGWALHDLGRIALAQGNGDSAIVLLGESQAVLGRGGDRVRQASALYYRALARLASGPQRNVNSP